MSAELQTSEGAPPAEQGGFQRDPSATDASNQVTPRMFDNVAEAARLGPGEVLARLVTSSIGLPWAEAKGRLIQFGPNELTSQRPPGWPQVLWGALKHPFNGVLAVLAAVSFATGDFKAGIVMLSMILLSVGLRFSQEMKSQVQ